MQESREVAVMLAGHSKQAWIEVVAAAIQAGEIGFPIVQFQSTLPRGERPVAVSSVTWSHGFNPRSRAGSDTDPAGFAAS